MTMTDKAKKQKPEDKEEKKTKHKPPKKEEKTKKDPKTEKETQTKEEEREILPPLEFSSLVLPFFTQALFKLGQLNQGHAKDPEGKLELAKRMIDLLDILKSRTQGNLKPEEQKFIDQCLHQLRMAYMEQAKIIKL
jgi:hypothetical protein